MDPNQENQGENSAGGSRQAIFTPQPPVVEGEAPTIPASAQASDGSSIHPYFSSHPTQTFNTEAGDIILNTSAPKPKQNKRPFIIGGVILAVFVLICVVVLLVVQAMSKPSKTDVVKSFNVFKNYIEYGPDNVGNDEGWYISQLTSYIYDTPDAEEESKKIKSLYSDFKSKLQQSSITLGNNLQNAIITEDTLLEYAILYIDLDNQIRSLVNNYIKADEQVNAESLATQIVPQRSDNNFYNDMREVLIKYIASELEIYAFYNDNFCLMDEDVDSECVALLDDDTSYTELSQRNKFLASAVEQNSPRLWSELKTNTTAVQKGLNE